jgi:dienelactone hydrolase
MQVFWRLRRLLPALALATFFPLASRAQDLPKGQVIPEVRCKADASQTYALYLPSKYDPARKWNLLLAFDPRARGSAPVELYQAAAEKYGYIVAGSNNSRNGPIEPSLKAANALLADVTARFSIDDRRMYVTGLSGGSRFALDYAMSTKKFIGVIASAAGFAESGTEERSMPFAIFATAGTEDFNYVEIRQLEREVTSPHRVRIFVGEHAWPPPDVAMEGIEWLELQAMKTGRRDRDDAFIDRIFSQRKAELEALKSPADAYFATMALVSDFQGLRDVSSFATRRAAMAKDPGVRSSIQAMMTVEMNESTLNGEIQNYSDQLTNPLERAECLEALRVRLTKLSEQAKAPEDTPERRMARRVLKGVLADSTGQNDPDYKKLLEEVKP